MSLEQAAATAIEDCMKVKEGEKALVVTDTEKEKIGRAFYRAAGSSGAEPVLVIMKPRSQHGVEAPAPVASAMASADVVLAPTTKSITHTRARKEACQAGARIATLPGITEDMMSHGGMNADYELVKHRADELAAKVEGSQEAVIKSPNGTNLTLDISNRPWHKDFGICENPGEFTNLPAGELYIAPRSARGHLVVDGSMAALGMLESPLELEIKEGKVVNIDGPQATELRVIIEDAGESGRNVAELGIGLNPAARLIGAMLEDEKVGGTVHVAIGDNSTFGGDVESDIHLDGIVTSSPQLFIDEVEIQLPNN